MLTRRANTCLLALAALSLLVPPAAAYGQGERDPFEPNYEGKPPPPAAEPPIRLTTTSPAADAKVERMIKFYLEMFSDHLQGNDWLKRAMAVVSLGRIDDARITEKLLEVLTADERLVVRVFAWEALHARTPSLSEDQRKRWAEGGWALAAKGTFRGALRVGLLGLMGSSPPTDQTRSVFMEIFQHTNLLDPGDFQTLNALREVIGKWRDPALVKALILEMANINNAYRAEYVLGGLGATAAEGWTPMPDSSTLVAKGSAVMWQETQQAWGGWFQKANLNAPAADALTAYEGQSRLLPPAETITDPDSPRWRKDLELGRLTLSQLDVTFAIDSTGSMTNAVTWIKRDVMKMMRAFGVISREPRIGVTFYRDHGDAYVVQLHPLTHRADLLAKAISGAAAKGGGDVPEAVHDALWAVIKRQRWSSSDRGARVIVLVGDAEPHPDTMDKVKKLVEEAAAEGFRFYCVKARTPYGSADMSSFDRIAEWGKGKSFSVTFGLDVAHGGIADGGYGSEIGPYKQVLSEVLKAILAAGYHDRAEPFVNVLVECLEEPVPEIRKPFGPARPPPPRKPGGGGHGPRPPHVPPKPYDPQAR